MDTNRRILAKALCWQAIGLVTGTAIGAMFTGSVWAGGGLAVTSAGVGLVAYVLHERAWSRVRWGRSGATPRR
ncbi:MAG: DUF2061 domain-containing protein [Pseudomonadota bacterium]